MNYELPSLKLTAPEDWPNQRLAWLALAEEHMYGHAPVDPAVRGEIIASEPVWDGAGVRETARIYYGLGLKWSFDSTIHRPAREGRRPVITWNQFKPEDPCPPLREIVADRGYIVAAFDKSQLTHDNNDGLPGRLDAREAYPNYDWGAIRIWAWGHQKLADYLITREDVDAGRLVATGHSRGGKTALAAALFDERFAACCANNSGAGGCGCFRYLGDRNGLNQDGGVVESMGRVGSAFPHWWGPGFKAFEGEERPDAMGRENELPFDLHTLKALIAPRALMSCEGLDDSWANPFGSWLTWKAAQPAFDLLGGRSYIYYREGGHGFGEEDWLAVADFCDELFFGKHTARAWNARDFSD